MHNWLDLEHADIAEKACLVRVDYNAPIKNGKLTDMTRLKASFQTLKTLENKNAKIILISHFGRPKGKYVKELSLKPVAEHLSNLIKKPIYFAEKGINQTSLNEIRQLDNRQIILLENLRFYEGEEKNSPEFSQLLSQFGDVYINDAFSASHRAHASIVGITHSLPSYAGNALNYELSMLEKTLSSPEKPILGIVGGAKISTKISILKSLVQKLDMLFIGGGMANTFLYALNIPIGKSLYEKEYAKTALEITELAKTHSCQLVLPNDVVTAKQFKQGVNSEIKFKENINADDLILDIGSQTIHALSSLVRKSKTVLWNGPLGAFETKPFDHGTITLLQETAHLCKHNQLKAIAGGGDTVSALNTANVTQDFTYVSTAGGAFLEWVEGKELPGIKALKQANKSFLDH